MDPVAAQVAMMQAETQAALAARIARMNVNADKAVASMLEQAADSLEAVVAAPPPGAGLVLDMSV